MKNNKNIFKYIILLILISNIVITQEKEFKNDTTLEINITSRGCGFPPNIIFSIEEKFELIKFEGKVCRNMISKNEKERLFRDDSTEGDLTYDENDIKIISSFTSLNKINNNKIKDKIKTIQLISFIESYKEGNIVHWNSQADWLYIPVPKYKLVYSEYISFQYGPQWETREVIDLAEFYGENPAFVDKKISDKLKLIKETSKKTNLSNEEIREIITGSKNTTLNLLDDTEGELKYMKYLEEISKKYNISKEKIDEYKVIVELDYWEIKEILHYKIIELYSLLKDK